MRPSVPFAANKASWPAYCALAWLPLMDTSCCRFYPSFAPSTRKYVAKWKWVTSIFD